MKLFLMRHGQAENNIRDIVSHSPNYWPLTPHGRTQVERSADNLARSQIRIDSVLISPLLRTQETYRIVRNRCYDQLKTAAIRTLESLTEINMGEWNDHWRSARSDKLFKTRTYERHLNDFSSFRLPSGESFRELAIRMMQFLFDDIVKLDSTANVLIISHADPLLSLQKVIIFMTGQSVTPKFPDNAEIIALHLDTEDILHRQQRLNRDLLLGVHK